MYLFSFIFNSSVVCLTYLTYFKILFLKNIYLAKNSSNHWLQEMISGSMKVKHVFHKNEQSWLGAKTHVCNCYLFSGDLWLWMAANSFCGKSVSGSLWQQQIWGRPALGEFTIEPTTDVVRLMLWLHAEACRDANLVEMTGLHLPSKSP